MEITGKKMLKGATWVYFGMAITALLGFLSNVFLAKMLDAQLWGLLSVVLFLVGIFESISFSIPLGLWDTMTYYISRNCDNKKKVAGYLAFFFKYNLAISLAMAGLMYLLANDLALLFNAPGAAPFIQIGAAYLFTLNLFSFFYTLSSSLRLFRQFGLARPVMSLMNVTFAPLLVLYGLGVNGALLGFALASAISAFIMVFFTREWFRHKPESVNVKDLANYGVYSMLVCVAGIAFNWSDFFLVGVFMTPVFVGFYRIAFVISAAVSNFLSSSKFVLFPSFAGLEAQKRRKHVNHYFNKSIELGAFFGIPATIGLALLAYPLTSLFFGQQYLAAAPALALLSFACIDGVLFSAAVSVFSACRKQGTLAGVIGAAALITVTMDIALIPIYGIIGAAVTNLCAKAAKLAACFHYTRKECGVTLNLRHLTQPLAASAPMAAAVYLTAPLLPGIYVLLTVALGAAVYLACQALLGFQYRQLFAKLRA